MFREKIFSPTKATFLAAFIVCSVSILSMFVWHHSMIKAAEIRLNHQTKRISGLYQMVEIIPQQQEAASQIEALSVRLQGMESTLQEIVDKLEENPDLLSKRLESPKGRP